MGRAFFIYLTCSEALKTWHKDQGGREMQDNGNAFNIWQILSVLQEKENEYGTQSYLTDNQVWA